MPRVLSFADDLCNKSAPQVRHIHKSPGVKNNIAPEAPRENLSPVAVLFSRISWQKSCQPMLRVVSFVDDSSHESAPQVVHLHKSPSVKKNMYYEAPRKKTEPRGCSMRTYFLGIPGAHSFRSFAVCAIVFCTKQLHQLKIHICIIRVTRERKL